eukprot:229052-Pyramimonas_sp.AAC.2
MEATAAVNGQPQYVEKPKAAINLSALLAATEEPAVSELLHFEDGESFGSSDCDLDPAEVKQWQ